MLITGILFDASQQLNAQSQEGYREESQTRWFEQKGTPIPRIVPILVP